MAQECCSTDEKMYKKAVVKQPENGETHEHDHNDEHEDSNVWKGHCQSL